MTDQRQEYVVAVMETPLASVEESFHDLVDEAVAVVEKLLTDQQVRLRIDILQFRGPSLSPKTGGGYSPLDFLRIGIGEKLERRPQFLVVVTNVDLAPTAQSYVLALPSELTNVAIISTKRLAPNFWGEPENDQTLVHRLAALIIHSVGHLLTLPHNDNPDNYMHDFHLVEELDQMDTLTPEQISRMGRMLPQEARDITRRSHGFFDEVSFTAKRLLSNLRPIWRTIKRANPLRLTLNLPTMITAGLSVTVVLFFSAETWDVASTIALYELAVFSLLAISAATALIYRAYGLPTSAVRSRVMAESIIVSKAATLITLLLTMIGMYAGFFLVAYLAIILIFPRDLMQTWPTVGPAVRIIDHVRLGMFMAAMGVLAGSLGGRAENKEVIRHILFIDEET